MPTITWLHISDLHWRETEAYEANVVAQALLRDLANRTEIAPELAKIDFIFVTGDIAFAGRPEEYMLAARFLKDLLRTTRVRKDRLFIVPGNHDVDRNAVLEDGHRAVAQLDNRWLVNRLLGDEIDRATVMRRFHRYRQFVNDYLGKYLFFDGARYFYVKKRKLAGRQIAILGLHSAWASASDNDRHNLFLGGRQVRIALEKAKRADIRIALLHHPFEWLRDFDRDNCEPLLLRGCDFVLHGHLHRTEIVRLQAPGNEAMVIGAGACYESREHRNAYNLVHLDFDLGRGTIYLRTYSDRHGGFWTKDVRTYENVRDGLYTFELPGDRVISKPMPVDLVSEPTYPKSGLEKWWKERGYTRNPFKWSNAADVDDQELFQLLPLWHVDPGTDAESKGLGPTPTLDGVKSPDTSKPVLIYAPDGGGKTFYRRWAAQQMGEEKQGTIQIRDIGGHLRDPKNVTAWDLAVCVYDQVCERLLNAKDPDPPEHVEQILIRCNEVIAESTSNLPWLKRMYIFIDDLGQLLDERPSMARRNTQTLEAIAEFCGVAAQRGGGEPLALRVFIPIQLKKQLQKYLNRVRPQLREYTILWSVDHCEAIIEKRLDSCWQAGPESSLNHISRLLAPDAFDELHRWLGRQRDIPPRCVINVLNQLGSYAYSHNLPADDLINAQLWNEFVKSREVELYASEVVYPLSRSAWKLRLPTI